jgi:hypothetical protein
MVGFTIMNRGLWVSIVAPPRTTTSPRLIHCKLCQSSGDGDGGGGKQVARERIDGQKQDRRQEIAEQLPERLFHCCLPYRGDRKSRGQTPGLPALVRFRFLAPEDVIDPGDDAAGPVLQFGADLIVRSCPGERFEDLGRGRFGFHDPHQHRIIEWSDNFDYLGGGRSSRNLLHQTLPPGITETT